MSVEPPQPRLLRLVSTKHTLFRELIVSCTRNDEPWTFCVVAWGGILTLSIICALRYFVDVASSRLREPLFGAMLFLMRRHGGLDVSFFELPRPSFKTPRFCEAMFDSQARWFRGLRVKSSTPAAENETPTNEGLGL